MSPAQSRIRDHVVNAALTAIATLFLTFGTGMWRSKETVSAHNEDIQRILDVLCDIKPQARACMIQKGVAGEVAVR